MRIIVVTTVDDREVRMAVASHDIGYMFDVLNASAMTKQVQLNPAVPADIEYAGLINYENGHKELS